MNIWFLRTDKDSDFVNPDISDISKEYPFIYSNHGICRGLQNKSKIKKFKKNIFPTLCVNRKELKEFIHEVKEDMVNNGDIDKGDKEKCDLFLSYWIVEMNIGDIVFVRNKEQKIFICKITGYISEKFFDEYCCIQRPVEILEEIFEDNKALKTIMHRTKGRKTLERNDNDNSDVEKIVSDYLKSNHLL